MYHEDDEKSIPSDEELNPYTVEDVEYAEKVAREMEAERSLRDFEAWLDTLDALSYRRVTFAIDIIRSVINKSHPQGFSMSRLLTWLKDYNDWRCDGQE